MENLIQAALMQQELTLLLVGMVFIAGILTSVTPCVYPLLPLTVGVVGRFAKNRRDGVIYSFLYVLGLAFTYAMLGVLAATTGQLFGNVASHPITLSLVAITLFVMAGWMMGWLRLPSWTIGQSFMPSARYRRSSMVLLGALSGLVMAPCTSPVLGMLLMFVAAQGDPLWGAAMMFAFAYGMSALLLIAGSFSGFLSKLPRDRKSVV